VCDGLRALPGLRPLVAAHVELRGIDTFLTGLGIELYEEIARRRPGIERRFIFVTGDNLKATTKQFLDRTGALSVSKPFEIDAIRRLVPLHAVSPGERDSEVALPS
jgi:hypothetical protein